MKAASTNGSSEAFTRGATSRRARFVASSFSDLFDLATCLHLSSRARGSELDGTHGLLSITLASSRASPGVPRAPALFTHELRVGDIFASAQGEATHVSEQPSHQPLEHAHLRAVL
eukprot:scaffold92877_cov81-Phaeocystis_antarctica.AAC.1